MFEVRIPSLGESVTEAIIARWAKQDGDAVAPDDVLLEIETDKASTELPAERAGVLRIVKREGETVTPGDVVARIEEGAGGSPSAAPPDAPAPAAASTPPLAGAPRPTVAPPAASKPVGPLSPAVRNLLAEHDLDPAAIAGSGKGGRLTKGDVLTHLERRATLAKVVVAPPPVAHTPTPPAPPAPSRPVAAGEERVPMSRIRKRIAERLVAAQHTAAILTTFNEIDMQRAAGAPGRSTRTASSRSTASVSVSCRSSRRACIAALLEIPALNAEIDGDDIVYRQRRAPRRGGRHRARPGRAGRAGRPSALVRRTSSGRSAGSPGSPATASSRSTTCSGGTFTISNGGVYGSLLSTPILNPPQSGILGMHKIEKRPVVGRATRS